MILIHWTSPEWFFLQSWLSPSPSSSRIFIYLHHRQKHFHSQSAPHLQAELNLFPSQQPSPTKKISNLPASIIYKLLKISPISEFSLHAGQKAKRGSVDTLTVFTSIESFHIESLSFRFRMPAYFFSLNSMHNFTKQQKMFSFQKLLAKHDLNCRFFSVSCIVTCCWVCLFFRTTLRDLFMPHKQIFMYWLLASINPRTNFETNLVNLQKFFKTCIIPFNKLN